MNVKVKTGVLIGVTCFLWTLVMGVTGWYKHPTLLHLFWVVIAIEVGFLIWGLGKTCAAGASYGDQAAAGTVMSLVAAVIIFAGSLLFTTVLFPNYFADLQAMQTEMLRAAGKTEAEVASAVALSAKMQTPLVNSLSGAVGTLVTGVVASLVIGAFKRSK